MARKALSKKARFEVFKRDSFTCQYCGRKAPEVVLHCDHIKSVKSGGHNDILNLITSCVDCNAGKGAKSLSDQSALAKQVDQLAELQAKREQIEMMIDWRQGLSVAQDHAIDGAVSAWEKAAEGTWNLSKTGRDRIRKLVKEHGLDLVLQAIPEAIDTYGKREEGQVFSQESIGRAFTKLGGVARVIRDSLEKPYLRRLFYIRGILRGRLNYLDEREALSLMEEAVRLKADVDTIERLSRRTTSWNSFRTALQDYIAEQSK